MAGSERVVELELGQVPSVFAGESADDAWRLAAGAVCSNLGVHQESRRGGTREILHTMLRISDPRQRWVLSRKPGLNPAFAIVEALWILAGRDDAFLVNFWNPALPRYAGDGDRYHGAYGQRLRTAFGFDQIEAALKALEGDPANRQTVLQIWDPRTDFPGPDGTPASPDIPCNVCAMLKVRHGRLEWLQIMRSNDLLRGTPYNIVQFTIVQEYMAGCLGLELGEFVQVADSLHCYEDDLRVYSLSSEKVPRATSRIALPKQEAREALNEAVATSERLAGEALTPGEFERLALRSNLSPGYSDFLSIVAADSARRRGWSELASAAVAACADAVLQKAWRAWEENRLHATALRHKPALRRVVT
jgi:thymidylate synthase